MSDFDDWMDDHDRFGSEGAFVIVTSDSGEYTDFSLTAEQIRTVFSALANNA